MWRWFLVGVPPLLLAVVGVAHPMTLSPGTSQRWIVLHVALIPIFPTLGVCLWFLLRHEEGALAVVGRVAAFVYACFYGALDTINGVAVGVLVSQAPTASVTDRQVLLRPVLDVGNALAWVGSSAFLLAAALTSALAVRRAGRAALLGAVLTVASAVSFLNSHIYWPRGVLTMLVLTAGLLLLGRHLDVRSPHPSRP